DPESAFDDLADGDTRAVTFTYTATDDFGAVSGTQTVTITVTGTNDAPVITATTGTDVGAVAEDGTLVATGQLSAADAEGQALTWSTSSYAGVYGAVSVDSTGKWTYTLDNAKAQALGTGTTSETFTVNVLDSQGASDTQTITITLTGTNDGATITGTRTGALTEDAATNTASGTLNVSDVDTGENVFQTVASGALAGTYGAFTFNATTGAWTYTLDNSKPAVQALGAGVTATDTLTVLSKDGTASETITVTITGTADANIVGTSSADTLTGTNSADIIDGLAGGDSLTGGKGADTFIVSDTFLLGGSGTSGTVSGFDVITDFVAGTDQIKLPVIVVRAPSTVGKTDGVDSTLATPDGVIRAHSISANGTVTFWAAPDLSKQVVLGSNASVAAAVEYLSLNDIGSTGATVTFATTIKVGGNVKNYIYQQPGDDAAGLTGTLVEINQPSRSPYVLNIVPGTEYIQPIALDLNQDGVTYIDRSEGVTYDFDNDGSAVSTAWVDSSDGLLAVQTEDGKLNIVFSTQEGETDLEGLAKVYDSNQDGVFDANDLHFEKFGVWQDSNSDGIVQAGEFKTLDEAGIVSLSLESSGEQYVTANGDVIVYGQSTFTTKDGVTHLLEDSGFATTTGTQMIGGISTDEPSLIATVSTTQDGQESLLGYSVVANLDMVEGKVGDELSLVINDGAVTIKHTLTAEDVANRRYEFRMSDNVIVTDVTNVVGVHLGALGSAISSYANPVSIPYTLLAPAAYVESHDSADVMADAESGSQTLQFSVMMSEVLVDPSGESKGLETEDFVVSNGTVTSVSMVDTTHYTLEVVSNGQAPLNAVSLDIALTHTPVSELQPLENNSGLVQAADAQAQGPGPDPAEFMLLELGGVTYMIDTSESNAADGVATDDYALTSSLSAPLVAGSWTEVVAGTEPAGEPTEPEEPVNPLTDTSAPPMINNEVLDDPRLTDNGSWTP
ncbi:VCBS domain-containing protein, partial [Zwartia vadi]|uniref:VCBS domain-containing protein n=1 Tax=Zwartia vadi TaxID=3058168 RepID=UPI0025B37C4F